MPVAHDIFARNKLTCFIKEEAAIKITVKCHAKVGPSALTTSAVAGVVFRQKWIGDAIWECRIGCVMHADKFKRRTKLHQPLRNCIKGWTRRTIARIHNNFQRPQGFDINET
jgi:hypothetical protein